LSLGCNHILSNSSKVVSAKGLRFPRHEPRGRDSDGASHETRLALLSPGPWLILALPCSRQCRFSGFRVYEGLFRSSQAMDHLLLPRCASAPLRVRCLSTGDYDSGPFASFPARHNWKVSLYETSLEETFSHGGEAPSFEEIEAFLQTWLYFGTLHEVFGEYVTMSDFIAVDESGNKFLCTGTLRSTMNGLLARSADRESLCRRVYSHLDELITKLTAFIDLPGIEDSGTIHAVTLLGEALHEFAVLEALGRFPGTKHINWTFFTKWITGHMKSSGWCPSMVMRLVDAEDASVSELYYCSQLPAPQGDRDHSSCSASSCMSLKIEPSTYRTVHTTGSCKCEELSLDVEFIREILGEGRLPLIEVAPDGEPCLFPREEDGSVGFVAISHVWAAGIGNVERNALPACSLQEISRLVNELPRGEHQGATLSGLTLSACRWSRRS
jgi:hypothetical protein